MSSCGSCADDFDALGDAKVSTVSLGSQPLAAEGDGAPKFALATDGKPEGLSKFNAFTVTDGKVGEPAIQKNQVIIGYAAGEKKYKFHTVTELTPKFLTDVSATGLIVVGEAAAAGSDAAGSGASAGTAGVGTEGGAAGADSSTDAASGGGGTMIIVVVIVVVLVVGGIAYSMMSGGGDAEEEEEDADEEDA